MTVLPRWLSSYATLSIPQAAAPIAFSLLALPLTGSAGSGAAMVLAMTAAQVLGAQAHVDAEHPQDLGPLARGLGVPAVHDRHAGAALHGLVGDGVAGDPEADHEDPQAGDVQAGPGALEDPGGAAPAGHEAILGSASR